MWYIKSYISNTYISLPCFFCFCDSGHFFFFFLMLESEGYFFQMFFFSSESNPRTFYFKEISIKSPFIPSFPSKNYKEMSLIVCTSTVLDTDWHWDPFAFPNFFKCPCLCFVCSIYFYNFAIKSLLYQLFSY